MSYTPLCPKCGKLPIEATVLPESVAGFPPDDAEVKIKWKCACGWRWITPDAQAAARQRALLDGMASLIWRKDHAPLTLRDEEMYAIAKWIAAGGTLEKK